MRDRSTRYLQSCLDRMQTGDASARRELLNSSGERLSELTRKMMRNYWRLKRWEETDDVFQSAMVRLHRALAEVTPGTLRDYYRLATTMIRRELIDMARHYFGPRGRGAKHESHPSLAEGSAPSSAAEPEDASHEPGGLAMWTEFHEKVKELPDEDREVFDLIWYQGLQQAEAAELIGVSIRTVLRRWQAACLQLHTVLKGNLPLS